MPVRTNSRRISFSVSYGTHSSRDISVGVSPHKKLSTSSSVSASSPPGAAILATRYGSSPFDCEYCTNPMSCLSPTQSIYPLSPRSSKTNPGRERSDSRSDVSACSSSITEPLSGLEVSCESWNTSFKAFSSAESISEQCFNITASANHAEYEHISTFGAIEDNVIANRKAA